MCSVGDTQVSGQRACSGNSEDREIEPYNSRSALR
jgi:hypothetical protein